MEKSMVLPTSLLKETGSSTVLLASPLGYKIPMLPVDTYHTVRNRIGAIGIGDTVSSMDFLRRHLLCKNQSPNVVYRLHTPADNGKTRKPKR